MSKHLFDQRLKDAILKSKVIWWDFTSEQIVEEIKRAEEGRAEFMSRKANEIMHTTNSAFW